jgi:hypothetical protein
MNLSCTNTDDVHGSVLQVLGFLYRFTCSVSVLFLEAALAEGRILHDQT